jgi:hypothetical protein
LLSRIGGLFIRPTWDEVGQVMAFVLAGAAFIFGGPIAGAVCVFIAVLLGLVLWTPVRGWLQIPPSRQHGEDDAPESPPPITQRGFWPPGSPPPRASASDPRFPDIEIHVEGRTIDNKKGIYWLAPVRITNHESERRASLTFKVYIDNRGESETGVYDLLNLPLRPATPTVGGTLSMPINLGPERSISGALAFDLYKDRFPAHEVPTEELTAIRLEVEDHLSGVTEPVPFMSHWRAGPLISSEPDADVVLGRQSRELGEEIQTFLFQRSNATPPLGPETPQDQWAFVRSKQMAHGLQTEEMYRARFDARVANVYAQLRRRENVSPSDLEGLTNPNGRDAMFEVGETLQRVGARLERGAS